jgi:hypothetical protein
VEDSAFNELIIFSIFENHLRINLFMKHLALLLAAALPTIALGQVGIGTSTPAGSAALELSATDKGFLPPRMTAAQRAAIVSPAVGLMVYQTDGTAGVYVYDGSNWLHQGQWYTVTSSFPSYFIGSQPANLASSGTYNLGVGPASLNAITTGDQNVAVGINGLKLTSLNSFNTAVGFNALASNVSATSNLASNNTAIGRHAGYSNVSGKENTFIGSGADVSSSALDNATAIGYNAEATASNSIQLGNSSVTRVTTYGSVGIGTTNPNSAAALEVSSTTKGLLLPRMTTVQRDAIVSPVAGLILYNTTDNKVQFYNGTAWTDL